MLSKMDMEGVNVNDVCHLVKGKRTKRRLRPPVTVVNTTVTSSCSSVIGGSGFSSTTFDNTEQEEADMANCLILLAQGKTERGETKEENLFHQNNNNNKKNKHQQNGHDSYECKTCNRFFHSFQALGGHRASHKKPKMKLEEKLLSSARQFATTGEFEDKKSQIHNKKITSSISSFVPPPVSLELRCGVNINFKPNRPNKIHECSICGAEFTSGQALGGHMRRHRACNNNYKNNNNNNNVVVTEFEGINVKSRNVLEFDLNLPAPEDDLRDSTLDFPALVGCHY